MPSNALIHHPLVDANPPPWAKAWGQDQYGIFADIVITGHGVTASQRLRWVPSGSFSMGSPAHEPGREVWEGAPHQVAVGKPFWMFDTPCTQQLWQAVMGDNPSYFVDDERPVETVSWADAVDFTDRLQRAEPSLRHLRLPSEKEWEFACRAGTSSATYAGPIDIVGENHATGLNAIAWYGGNAGVDFDLDNGVDSSGWSEKEFEHRRAGTRKVGLKQPNAWGLFDMLGNVWEWCFDWWAEYDTGKQVGVAESVAGQSRVLRGGCWRYPARYARSAYRYGYLPGLRSSSVGFRCAQVPEG